MELDDLLDSGAPKARRFQVPTQHPELVADLERYAQRVHDGTTNLALPELFRHWFSERSPLGMEALRNYVNFLRRRMSSHPEYAEEVRMRG